MPPKRRNTEVNKRRRQARAVVELRSAYESFEKVLADVQRQADTALQEGAVDHKGHAALLDSAHVGSVGRAHFAYGWAALRAVRVGVLEKRLQGDIAVTDPRRVLREIPPMDRPEALAALNAAVQWLAVLQTKESLSHARSRGFARGVRRPWTDEDMKIARVAFATMRSGRQNWAAQAQRDARAQGLIDPIKRQAFHERLRRLLPPPRVFQILLNRTVRHGESGVGTSVRDKTARARRVVERGGPSKAGRDREARPPGRRDARGRGK